MTIHDTHPFADPEPDPVRRLRGRLGGAVTLLTSGAGADRVGLTVSSLLVAGGDPGRVVALVDPDSELRDTLEETGRGVLCLLSWRHRDLADAFAGTAPAPGGPFRLAEWEQTAWGPRLVTATGWAALELDSVRDVGWSAMLECRLAQTHLAEDLEPLEHRRGRYAVASYAPQDPDTARRDH